MNGFDLTASIIQSIAALAWPAAFICGIFVFRAKLQEILPFLRLRHKDTEISFRLEEAAKEAATLEQQEGSSEPLAEEVQHFEKIAQVHPRGAIIETWMEVEAFIREKLSEADQFGQTNPRLPVSAAMSLMRRNGMVTSNLFALFQDLRAVRTAAVHGTSQPTTADAFAFKKLTYKFVNSFEIAESRQPSLF